MKEILVDHMEFIEASLLEEITDALEKAQEDAKKTAKDQFILIKVTA